MIKKILVVVNEKKSSKRTILRIRTSYVNNSLNLSPKIDILGLILLGLALVEILLDLESRYSKREIRVYLKIIQITKILIYQNLYLKISLFIIYNTILLRKITNISIESRSRSLKRSRKVEILSFSTTISRGKLFSIKDLYLIYQNIDYLLLYLLINLQI